MSGGYFVITAPSRKPTNQTKRDKDKQRFELTSSDREGIKRRQAEQTKKVDRKKREKKRERNRERKKKRENVCVLRDRKAMSRARVRQRG